MSFGQTPISTTILGTNQFPVSAVAVPGTTNGDFTALEGGPTSTDVNNNKTAPASMYIKDGSDVSAGAMADAAITDATQTTKSRMAFLKGMVKILADVWDSTNHLLHIDNKQIAGMAISVNAGTADAGTQRVAVASIGASVALTAPPANTNAGSDTALTFASKVNHFLIQNNTAANAYIMLDTASSTAGVVLVPGALWRDDIPVTSPHVYTAAAQPLNAASGIIVEGWL